MEHSQALRLRDIRGVFHLLEEVTERGIDPHAWRQHMLAGLCRLTGARLGISMGLRNALPGTDPVPIDPITHGFTSNHEQSLWVRYLRSDELGEDPATHALVQTQLKRRSFLKSRQEMIDSKSWYSSPVVMESRRPAGVDHYLMSSTRANRPGVLFGASLYRAWGEAPFTARQQSIARLFHLELLRRLWPLSAATDAAYIALPHRLRLALRCFLDGKSAKETAESLGLSTQTINSYTKDLYARLNVDSRSQLLTRFLNRPGGRPIFVPATIEE